MSKIHFVAKSSNSKTGAIPVTYSERATCPPDCGLYGDCYGEDYHTRLSWDKVAVRGIGVEQLAARIEALPDGQVWRFNIVGDLPGEGKLVDAESLGMIVWANRGRKGYTYTHKKTAEAIRWAAHANDWGFTINLSADDAGEADALYGQGSPVVCLVPSDTPSKAYTPAGRTITVCPAQDRDITCEDCQLCAIPTRQTIIGFRPHGTKAKFADTVARRVIPIARAA